MSNDEQKTANSSLVKRILLFVGIVLLVCLCVALFVFRDYLNIDGVRRWFKYLNVRDDGTYGVYSFDSHNSNAYASLGNGLAVASVGGLDSYDANGNELASCQARLSLPVLQSNGQLAMAYDAGGTTLLLTHQSTGEVLRVGDVKAILDADLAADGSLCYSATASGYKSVLTVYSNKQKILYRWLSSTVYMPVCAVSPGAEYLAAVGLGQTDGNFTSMLYFFRTNSDTVYLTVELGGDLYYDLHFTDRQTLCAIGETEVRYYSLDGDCLGVYSYGENYLKDYCLDGDGFLTLSMNMYKAGNRYSLLTVDRTGQEIGSVYVGQEILDLSVCEKYIAVLTANGLTVYDMHFRVQYETEDIGTANSVVMREDGSVLLLGSGRGELYIP